MTKLNVLSTPKPISPQKKRLIKLEKKWEDLWQNNPEKQNPNRSAREKQRIERTWSLIERLSLDPSNTTVLDLGCGFGEIGKRLENLGFNVTFSDISISAKKNVSDLPFTQASLPNTSFPNESFDLVICTDVIAELDSKDHRIAFSELARILRPDGTLILSTPIDIYSVDALEKFLWLTQTEFHIHEQRESHHALSIRCEDLLKYPMRPFNHAKKMNRLKKCLHFIHSHPPISTIWKLLSLITSPLLIAMQKSNLLLDGIEKISSKSGASHIILTTTKRPL